MRFLDVAKVYASSGAGGNGCPERRAAERSEGVARATKESERRAAERSEGVARATKESERRAAARSEAVVRATKERCDAVS
jgi:hypothetical protein